MTTIRLTIELDQDRIGGVDVENRGEVKLPEGATFQDAKDELERLFKALASDALLELAVETKVVGGDL